jgi:hypothetical protein
VSRNAWSIYNRSITSFLIFIYAFDAEGDGKALRAINLADTIAEPVIRTRANMKVGFTHVNGNEIVFYNSAA